MRLDPRATAAGFRLIAYDAVTSTNTEALRLSDTGERGPLWLTAHTQSAGRGRRGRNWTSVRGNLYASLLLPDPAPLARRPEVSFVAALAVHDAVAAHSPHIDLRLKWPNDLLANGRKCAGILIEAGAHDALVIGIGINCVSHPAGTDYPAADLTREGAAVGAQELFTALSNAMVDRLAQWRRGEGFAEVRADWLERASGLGRDLRVHLPDRVLSGSFDGLDEHGRLLLRLADGRRETISAGDVFPVAPEKVLVL
jgi:BirA family biotin operon repressor/biotin-[acetyl-CoA-carboxylase] ligase